MIQVRGAMRKLSLFQDGTMSPDLDVKTVMDTWTLQMGFPLVSVSRDYEARTASVTQERFLVGERRPDLPRLSWWGSDSMPACPHSTALWPSTTRITAASRSTSGATEYFVRT